MLVARVLSGEISNLISEDGEFAEGGSEDENANALQFPITFLAAIRVWEKTHGIGF